jgi:outer membrane protein assembly factor BamB
MKLLRSLLIGLLLFLGCSVLFHFYAAVAEQNSTREPLWSVPIPAIAAPFAEDGRLFVPTAHLTGENTTSRLQALDAVSGQVLWVSEEPIQRILTVEGGNVYASNKTHRLMVLDANTGKTTAAFQLKMADPQDYAERALGQPGDAFAEYQASVSSAIGASGGAFIASIGLGLEVDRYEISAQTPEGKRWTFLTPPASLVASSFYEPYDVTIPTVRNGVVVLPILVNPQTEERGYQVVGLDAATGRLLWRWETSEDFLDDLSVIDDTVYVAYAHNSANDQLSWVKALDLRTGRERWSYPIFGKVKLASDREVFVWKSHNDTATHFIVLEKQTGAWLRELDLVRQDSREPRQLALADNTLYTSDLAIENATVGFYATADNHSWIEAFDATTGIRKWRTPTLFHSHVYNPIIAGDRLFVTGRALNDQGQNLIQAFDRQ